MADPNDLAASIGRQDRVRLFQWNDDGTALDEKDATMDQLGAAVVARVAATPALAAAMPKNLAGDGAPLAGLGNDGDSYVNLDNGDTYLKAAGAWTLQGNIAGPTGPKGDGLVPGTGAEPYDVNFHAGANVYMGFNFNDPRFGDDTLELRSLNIRGKYYLNGVEFSGGGGGGVAIQPNAILGNAPTDSAGGGYSVALSTDFTLSGAPRTLSIAAQALRNLAVWPSMENPARDYGATGNGIADDSAAVNAAVAAAIVAGTWYVQIDRSYSVPNLDKTCGEVIFVGRGALTGHALTRQKLVIPPFAPPPPRPARGVIARVHLPTFTSAIRSTGAATVVVGGDSVSTPMVGSVSSNAALWSRLVRKIQADNPGASLTFYNRGIGGQRVSNLDGLPTSFPLWYTDPLRAWLEYIEDLAPHIVVLNFARNDSLAFSLTALRSVLGKMAAWATPPDVVISTSVGDKITAAASAAAAATTAAGMDYAAGGMRSMARALGHGLLDLHRAERLHRWGYDVDTLPLLRDNALTGGSSTIFKYSLTLPLTWPTNVYDFGGIFYIGAGGWTSLGNELTFEIGSHVTVANRGNRFRLRRNSGTGQIEYRVEVLSTSLGAESDWVFRDWTAVPNWIVGPTAETGFTFQVSGTRVYLEPASYGLTAATIDRYTPGIYIDVPRVGGPFVPSVTCPAGSVAGVLRLTNNTVDGLAAGLSGNPGMPPLYMPTLVDSQTGLPHPIDTMWEYLQPVIDACDFCATD